MAAIEYGSYYWCVILQGKDANSPGESVHLHADEMTIDENGALVFKSAGRRPAGAEPKQQNEKQENKDANKTDEGSKNGAAMIFMAFAAGTWKVVYAAKLQDGAPAVVEHWDGAAGSPGLLSIVPANSGASGYPAREEFASRT